MSFRRSLSCVTLLLAIVALTSCNTVALPTPRPTVKIHLVGSDSMQSLANALARAYSESRGGVEIDVQTFDSQVGLTAPLQNDKTIGMVARAIKPTELDQRQAVVIARDGVAVIVNNKNPINAIQHVQVAQIFAGEILTWPAGPMAGQPIVVISREQGSGTRQAFESMLMSGKRVTLTAILMPGEAAVVDYIAQHPDTIGYASMGAIMSQVHSLAVDDVHLSPSSVESTQYPFIRMLSLVTRAEPNPDVQEFVDFALSSQGQAIVGQRFGRAPAGGGR